MLSSKFSARGELQRLSSVKGSDLPGRLYCVWEAKRQSTKAISPTKRLRTSHLPKSEPRVSEATVNYGGMPQPAIWRGDQVTTPMSWRRQVWHRWKNVVSPRRKPVPVPRDPQEGLGEPPARF